MSSDFRVTPSVCYRCGAQLDAARSADGVAPAPGAVSICAYCGTVALFAENCVVREPSLDELRDLLESPFVMAVLERLWDDGLAVSIGADGVVFACGCRTTTGEGLFTLEACSEVCAAAQTVMAAAKRLGRVMYVIR